MKITVFVSLLALSGAAASFLLTQTPAAEAAGGSGGARVDGGSTGGTGGSRDGGTGGTGGACSPAGSGGAYGSVTSYLLPDGLAPYRLYPDASGGMWATGTGRTVTHLTSAGALASYDLGTTGCSPMTYEVDACGNLLWESTRCGQGGRVSPGGAQVAYPLSQASSGCRVLVRGSDGRFWSFSSDGRRVYVLVPGP